MVLVRHYVTGLSRYLPAPSGSAETELTDIDLNFLPATSVASRHLFAFCIASRALIV